MKTAELHVCSSLNQIVTKRSRVILQVNEQEKSLYIARQLQFHHQSRIAKSKVVTPE